MINIPFKYIKAADIFRDEKDVRTFCKGFVINDSKLMTTNGHYLFIADISSDDAQLIFNFIGKIPASADIVEIDFKEKLATFNSEKKGVVAQMGIEILDGQVFDYKRVTNSFESKPVDAISFQGQYLNDLAKAAKIVDKKNVIIEPSGANGASRIGMGADCSVYLMPCRI